MPDHLDSRWYELGSFLFPPVSSLPARLTTSLPKQVAYEYIACQQERHGVLILSEFAGAAHSLNGSLIVNPWNTAETANALNHALTMDAAAREDNHNKLFRYVSKYTAAHWVSFSTERRKVGGPEPRLIHVALQGTGFVAELMGVAEKEDDDVPDRASTHFHSKARRPRS